ncbi:MAG: hypothetical protein EXS14_07190 [Planctomycetes bacterium]|nr:hypothetical protein [Planctomycetota bacterium]
MASAAVAMAAVAPAQVSARGESWGDAVARFSRVLLTRGYSRFTVRDYTSDVFRLAGQVDVLPEKLCAEHISRTEHTDHVAGLAVQTQRRRASAYAMFHAWIRQDPALGDPAALLLAENSPLVAEERMLVALTALAGLRLNEIRHLEGRDISVRQQVVRSRMGWRIIPMHPELLRLIEEHAASRPLHSYRALIMGPSGYRVHERTLHGRFHRMAVRCEVPTLTPDMLRRATAERLRVLGTPPTLVRAFIGLERSQPLAPRRGQFIDLSCMRERIRQLL